MRKSVFKRFKLKWTELFSVRFFKGSDASCANVAVRFLTVFYVGNFLYVYFERSSRFTVGVAYVVAGSLTFTANITYSRHINTSANGNYSSFQTIEITRRFCIKNTRLPNEQ